MTTNRYARVKELYEQNIMEDILLKGAAGKDDLSELERELAGELPETLPEKPQTPKKPGIPTKKTEKPSMTPVEELEKELIGTPPTEKTPSAIPEESAKKEKPIVMPSTKISDPQMGFAFEPKRYTLHEARASVCPICHYENRPVFMKECRKCKNLYNRMKKKVDNYDLSPEQAIRSLSAETGKAYSMLKTIYGSQGITPLTIADIKEVNPSLSKQVEDMLWYRRNVKKDEKTGEPLLDEHGLPIPLEKTVEESTKWLALALRLTPELFTQRVDEYNAGKKEKDRVKPILPADIISDAPGRRYKATYLSVWNKGQIKKLFTDIGWIKKLEEKIIPEEKIERAKTSIKRLTQVIEESKSQQETVEEELKILARDNANRKYLKLLRAFRKATPEQAEALEKKYKVTKEKLEKKYGKELDYFIKMLAYKKSILDKIANKVERAENTLERRKDWLFKLLEGQGYKFSLEAEIDEKKNNAELSELEKEIAGEGGEEGSAEPSELDELERELTSRLNTLHRLLRFAAPLGPKQMGLFGDEPEEEEDPEEKLRKMLESQTGNVNIFPGPQPAPEFPPEPEPEPEPTGLPSGQIGGPALPEWPGPFKPKKIVELFGTNKGRYKIRFMSTNLLTKEKKTLSGVFQYTPGARSKSVEDALKKRITDKFKTLLVETHGVGPGSYVRAIVTDPTGIIKAFSFNIDKDGEVLWHGTKIEDRRRKLELLESQPKEKSMWTMGLIKLDDLVEVDGKLIEKELLEKGYISPEEHKIPKIKEQKVPYKPVSKSKRIDDLRQKRELKTIKEEELNELNELETTEKDMARIKELESKDEPTPEEKAELTNLKSLYEDVKFDPMSRLKPIEEPAEHEPVEFTRECPYKGCGAKVPEDAKTCWKCKSPIAKNEMRKVVMRRIKVPKERIVKDPTTGQMVTEEYTIFPPIHSLVTITTDDDGKPQSAHCEKLNVTYKESGGTKEVPAFPSIMKEIQGALDKIQKDPKYTPEQKENAKERAKAIYERKVSEKESNTSPWKTIRPKKPQAGLPRDACENCPAEVMAPFVGACDEISVALKSLDPEQKLPYGYVVWDYEKVRSIKESTEPVRHPWVTEKVPEADDGKYASRFDTIMKLYLAD